MKLPNYKKEHLKKAEEYKIKIDNREGNYDDNYDLYLFHLTQAGAWNILIDMDLKSLEIMKTRFSEDQFYSNSNAFNLIYSLHTKYEKLDDKENAKKMFLELLKFQKILDSDIGLKKWNPMIVKPKNQKHENGKLKSEEEFDLKRGIPQKNKKYFARRMKQLGDLAFNYDYNDKAIDFYLFGIKQLESYIFNIKDNDYYEEYNLLKTLYFNAQHFEALKQLFIWRYFNFSKRSIGHKADLLEKIGFINTIQNNRKKANDLYFEAANFYLDHALKYASHKQSSRAIINCNAIFLFNKANRSDFITHYSKQTIIDLNEIFLSKEIRNNWIWGEYLKRIYQIINKEKKAKSIAKKIITQNTKDIENKLVKLENEQKNIIYDYIDIGLKHLGLSLCEEFLNNYDSSITNIEKTEEYFKMIFNLRKGIYHHIESLPEWNLIIKFCQCLKTKLNLKINVDKSINIENCLHSFLQLNETENIRFVLPMFNGIIYEELYDFYKLIIHYDPDAFDLHKYDSWNLYYTKDEEEFLNMVKNERKEFEKPKDMKKAIEKFKLKINKEKWSQETINEILKLYYEKNFDVTEWPEEALKGFKMIIEKKHDLDFIYSEGFREDVIIAILIATAKEVIKT